MEYPFGQLGSAVPPLPTSCASLAYSLGGMRSRKGLGSVLALISDNEKVPVFIIDTVFQLL